MWHPPPPHPPVATPLHGSICHQNTRGFLQDRHQAVHQNYFKTLLLLYPPLSAPCYKPLPPGTRLDYMKVINSIQRLDEVTFALTKRDLSRLINPASTKCNHCNPPQRNDSFHDTGPARRSEPASTKRNPARRSDNRLDETKVPIMCSTWLHKRAPFLLQWEQWCV